MTGEAPACVRDAESNSFRRDSEHCLDGRIADTGEHPVSCGGHADIWKGRLAQRAVAVKVARPWSSAGGRFERARMLKRLWREYLAWSSLSHPNVMELLGFSYGFSPEWFTFPALVSPWMSNGTVDVYIENQKISDRVQLLLGIAEGILYLHTREPAIVHGNLRAGNVLVSDAGVPCLSDFGLSRVLNETKQKTTSSAPAGSLRWMSPELFRSDGSASVYSDVWAFGMTVLEVITGKRPYVASQSDGFVFGQIADGIPPPRERILDDELWSICWKCWHLQPGERPWIGDIILLLSDYFIAGIKDHRPDAAVPANNNPGTLKYFFRESVGNFPVGIIKTQLSPTPDSTPSTPAVEIPAGEAVRPRSEGPTEIPQLVVPAAKTPKPQGANAARKKLRESLQKLVHKIWPSKPLKSAKSSPDMNMASRPAVSAKSTLGSSGSSVSISAQSSHEALKPERALSVGPLFREYAFSRDDEGCLDGSVTGIRDHLPGHHTDVWKGNLGILDVAVKCIRPLTRPGSRAVEQKILERLWRQYSRSTLDQHPNIIHYLGFSYDASPNPSPFPALISPWMSKGTLSSYLAGYPGADIYELAQGVARGLSYLHALEPPIVHGDVRAENILISDAGVPCLSEICMSDILKLEGVDISANIVTSLRWAAPELLQSDVKTTPSSDVWAYGMTLLEIFSRNVPYQEVKSPAAVFGCIRAGYLPERPAYRIPQETWSICLRCWNVEWARPNMRTVLENIEAIGCEFIVL